MARVEMEEALNVYREDSMKHQGGGGGEWSVTPGDFWSRGAEPSLLVDRFEICLGRVLRWSRPINGP